MFMLVLECYRTEFLFIYLCLTMQMIYCVFAISLDTHWVHVHIHDDLYFSIYVDVKYDGDTVFIICPIHGSLI